jgi:hypothetical protein
VRLWRGCGGYVFVFEVEEEAVFDDEEAALEAALAEVALLEEVAAVGQVRLALPLDGAGERLRLHAWVGGVAVVGGEFHWVGRCEIWC